MNIIPQDFKFVIEARIETQFVDNLYAGQPARIRFTSFNQRQTPELQGEVQDISASTFMEEQTGLSYYIAKIRLNEGEETKLKGKRLISGIDERSLHPNRKPLHRKLLHPTVHRPAKPRDERRVSVTWLLHGFPEILPRVVND